MFEWLGPFVCGLFVGVIVGICIMLKEYNKLSEKHSELLADKDV